MNKLENLKDELLKVVAVANQFNISHTDVAKESGIGYEYSRQIRNGEKLKTDNKDNRETLQKMIDGYRQKIREKKRLLNSVDIEENTLSDKIN